MGGGPIVGGFDRRNHGGFTKKKDGSGRGESGQKGRLEGTGGLCLLIRVFPDAHAAYIGGSRLKMGERTEGSRRQGEILSRAGERGSEEKYRKKR